MLPAPFFTETPSDLGYEAAWLVDGHPYPWSKPKARPPRLDAQIRMPRAGFPERCFVSRRKFTVATRLSDVVGQAPSIRLG